MIRIQSQQSLQAYNTFGVDVNAKYFAEVHTVEELQDILQTEQLKTSSLLVLGGGSNMLLTKDYDGFVLKMSIKGMDVREEGKLVFVNAGGGEVWNDFVQFCVNRGYAGVENLSLIPGSVGASPIQNIGAYGVEMKDCFYSLQACEVATGNVRTFTREECRFGYRDSIFKNELRGQYIITSVLFRLSKTAKLNLSYGAIEEELQRRGITHPTIKDVSDVVSHIRVSKLPDPSTIGNSGSFFKNPVISENDFKDLQHNFPEVVHYPAGEGKVKVAAGWLIEQCGWKGKVHGHTGTWKNQALVIVNHGGATGKEVYDFSTMIIDSVRERFGVTLEREVNIF
jgi:UDP-N-acetylmuramate dehydrogenase